MPLFEFDSHKSATNRMKHGVDFVEAQEIWKDLQRLEVRLLSTTEERFQVIGKLGGQIWSAFITYRGEAVRIISVRRARTRERRKYEESKEKPDGSGA